MRRLIILLLGVGLMQSCAVKKPSTSENLQKQAFANFILPSTWQNSSDTIAIKENWLSIFNDPVLDTLVGEALVYNPDIRISSARIEQANGYVLSAQAALLPALSILGRGTSKMGGDFNSGLNGAVFSASWELDLWGKLRNARNAEEANLAALQGEVSFAKLSLAANVAKTYYLASETYLQIQLAKRMLAISSEMKDITQKRYEIGIGTEIDVVQSDANLNKLKNGVKQMELAYANQLRALELMLGRYPAGDIEVKNSLEELHTKTPAGVPMQILERRPDVLAAQERFNAAFYRVGEAKAARLPKLKLTAGFGLIDSDLLVLASDFSNPITSVGGELMAPIYQGGALKANVYIRTAQQKQVVEEYRRAVLNAMSDVEGTLDQVHTVDEREKFLKLAVQSNQRAFELEQQRFEVGQVDMRGLIIQQMDLFRSEVDLLSVRGEKIIQRINLYLALGGSM